MRTSIAKIEICNNRVLIFQRSDASYGYSVEKSIDDDLGTPYWTPSLQDSEMYCESLAVAIREVVSRVDWLNAAFVLLKEKE